ncbi:MAG: DUF983 domain-containing protein [Devosia nanyangense]|uniref:DUF983 domain-containing protein n=1 Tax=Devosia nanyangense TaxID=1228055 RepID=A0A933L5B8_9HYPH|nr:DUF983 domain-containing protein [Devosia nanyangense]
MPVTIATDPERRSVGSAVWNGARLRCPHCGKGHMFRAYLKVADHCDVCGEELFHHKADDMPPYLSILIVGHVIVGLMLHLEMSYTIAPWVYVATMVPIAALLPLVMLPSIKGAVVGMQWANRMYGFDPINRVDPAQPSYP